MSVAVTPAAAGEAEVYPTAETAQYDADGYLSVVNGQTLVAVWAPGQWQRADVTPAQ